MVEEKKMHESILVSKAVSKSYDDKIILKDINFSIFPKEIISLVGPSGIGKTTLLNILSGLEASNEGEVISNAKIGYVFQEARLLPWLTLFENIKLINLGYSDDVIWKNLELVNLKDFHNYFPEELSGGMKQRGSIARALTYGGNILFLDEPFKSLDEKLRYEMLDMLKKLRDVKGVSCLFITHDIDEALYVSDRILLLSGEPATIEKEIFIAKEKENGELSLENEVKIKREIFSVLYNK